MVEHPALFTKVERNSRLHRTVFVHCAEVITSSLVPVALINRAERRPSAVINDPTVPPVSSIAAGAALAE